MSKIEKRTQDGVGYVKREDGLWEEANPVLVGRQRYPLNECATCGRLVSVAGWSWNNHQKMHGQAPRLRWLQGRAAGNRLYPKSIWIR